MSISKYHVSANKFDVNGTYSLKATAITITDNSLVDVNQSSGAADRIYYDKIYSAGTYTISLKTDNTLARFFSPMQFTGGTYNSYYGGYYKDFESDNVLVLTFETDFTIGFIFRGSGRAVMSEIMLNTGSTPQPYEPYGDSFKDWFYREYGTETETFTTLPKTIIGDGQPISSWSMDGNMQVNGTPTPQNPITPAETGDKTANLYNTVDTSWTNGYLDNEGQIVSSSISHFTTNFTEVEENTTYTWSGTITESSSSSNNVYYYDGSKNWISKANAGVVSPRTFTTPSNCRYIRFQVTRGVSATSDWLLNKGNEVISYEPYGYKIPILSNGNTYPIYLSEPIRKYGTYVDDCQSTGITTRKVYKLVIAGNEGWTLSQVSGNVDTTRFYLNLSVLGATAACLCNYLTYDGGNADTPHIRIGNTEHNQLLIYVPSSIATTTTELATWLQGLYNNGNPLTVWYPLGTSTTESFTAPTLPTSGSSQTFDVDTTLKPSEVSLTYHGWHDHTDTKYTSG